MITYIYIYMVYNIWYTYTNIQSVHFNRTFALWWNGINRTWNQSEHFLIRWSFQCREAFSGLVSGNSTYLWKITIFNGKIHYRSPFSMAMLSYRWQRKIQHLWMVFPLKLPFFFRISQLSMFDDASTGQWCSRC